MTVGTLMGIVTLVFFVMFVGIVVWAYSSRRRADFDEASHLPLNDIGDDRQHGERRS